MRVTALMTHRIVRDGPTIIEVLDQYLPSLSNGDVVVITSKIISICEGRLVSMDEPLESIVRGEADYYLPADIENYNQRFTIAGNTLTARAGIDVSPKNGYYILWPQNPQLTANKIRQHLAHKHGLHQIGVVLSDSISTPLRRGVTGIAIAHSGFRALNDYHASRANIAGGLAASAVLAMGEGTEQTPIAIINELSLVEFQDRDPTDQELHDLYVSKEEDFFAPFINNVPWQRGGHGKPSS